MRDDFLTRDWADGHHQLSRSIHKGWRRLAGAFVRFHAQRYAAPWRSANASKRLAPR